MLKVGLTGGIGSGKTTVAKIFTSLGVPVFFADQEARKLMESSDEIIHSVKAAFGEESYTERELNRKYLAKIVFNDQDKLNKLNQITHAAVHRSFEAWLNDQHGAAYVVEEAALLFESGAWNYFDYLLLITAPLSIRIERVMARDMVAEQDVRNRINSQMPEEEKIPLSHYLIFNDDKSMVLPQVLAFHEKMISLKNK